jgi:hypothetical protein
MAQLKKHKWNYEMPKSTEYSIVKTFNNRVATDIFRFNGKEVLTEELYYLSDTVTYVFDSTRVSKVKKGNYIISYNKKGNETNVLEIQVLNDSVLVLKAILNPQKVFVGGGNPVYFRAQK